YFNINNPLLSLPQQNKSFPTQTIHKHKQINHLHHQINDNLIILITRQQPIPKDLPIVIPALKISTHFQPIGHNPPTIAHIPLTVKINH
ncbi:PhoU domain-containing protein, partial [Staphylococcus epidermidis]|uniref:PhoU domain-containing protein n=1 Tax=Staphylococcus epidermidis TaxID=1282 RepID=UPI0034D9764B